MNETTRVASEMVVSLDYTLRLDDEQIIDTSQGREPLEFIRRAHYPWAERLMEWALMQQ